MGILKLREHIHNKTYAFALRSALHWFVDTGIARPDGAKHGSIKSKKE